jgi:hypothetical protein
MALRNEALAVTILGLFVSKVSIPTVTKTFNGWL